MRTPCQADPELWVSDSPPLRGEAVKRCGPCGRKAECLIEAMERRETLGVYGGRDFTHTKAGKAPGGGPTTCANCGAPIRQPKQGNRRKYCSEHCGYLARRAA